MKSLFQVINSLVEEKAVLLPYAEKAQKYIAVGETDSEVKFTRTEDEVVASFKDLVWSKSGVNLSIRFQEHGLVEISDEDVQLSGLPKQVPVCRYKTWALARNGVSSFNSLYVRKSDGTEESLDVANLPLFSDEEMVGTELEVLKNQVELLTLEARAKIIEGLLKTSRDLLNKKKLLPGQTAYNAYQAEVLKKYHVNASGVYNPPSSYKSSSSENSGEKPIEFQIKGLSSLPSWNAFEKAAAEKKCTTTPLKFMANQYNILQEQVGDLFDLSSLEVFTNLTAVEIELKEKIEAVKREGTLYRAMVKAGKISDKEGEVISSSDYTLIVKK